MRLKKTSKPTPSLLEPQSSGGETAQKGFVFQDGVLLSQIPKWLAHEGFTGLTRESIGDSEVKFFVPGQGFVIDLWEAKDHNLTPSEFWNEIIRFQAIYKGSPGTYRTFTLASVGLSANIQPIETALRRIRDPYEFYGPHSPIIKNSYQEFEERVVNTGHSKEAARFLFDHVLILSDFGIARDNAEGLFRQGVNDWLPAFQDLRSRDIGMIYTEIESLMISRRNRPISRKEVEATILNVLGQTYPLQQQISICTTTNTISGNDTDLPLDWADFFGRDNRQYSTPGEWNTRLLGQLRDTQGWILQYRSERRIRLSGSRRLTADLAIGSVFSAVSGFAIDLEYRGKTWSTDTFPNSSTPEYIFSVEEEGWKDPDLVVVIGILREIVDDVKAALSSIGIQESRLLYLYGREPIVSPQQANLAVSSIKKAIDARMAQKPSERIHLFVSGPSPVALFLGHRLNAVAPIQCYEWIGKKAYVPTCLLYSNK